MKKIIIFLLIVILGFVVWGQYKKYQRFSLEGYEYEVPGTVASMQDNKALLLDYYEAVEDVNGHVITEWSANGIDVRNPNDDDAVTTAAVNTYHEKLANVKYYEALLLNPKTSPKPKEKTAEEKRRDFIRAQYYADPSANELRLGEQNALVFEVQRLLISKGDSILHDGLFRTETFNSLKSFEEKNGLFPDGKLDALTLEALLR